MFCAWRVDFLIASPHESSVDKGSVLPASGGLEPTSIEGTGMRPSTPSVQLLPSPIDSPSVAGRREVERQISVDAIGSQTGAGLSMGGSDDVTSIDSKIPPPPTTPMVCQARLVKLNPRGFYD